MLSLYCDTLLRREHNYDDYSENSRKDRTDFQNLNNAVAYTQTQTYGQKYKDQQNLTDYKSYSVNKYDY